jgi:ribokinase
MSIPIYVIGSSNTDMVIKTTRLPMPGETVMGTDFFMNAGGKGANQAVAAARLGGKVTLVARVGNDLFGQQALQQFERENIDTRFIGTDQDHPSGVALIGVDAQGENSIMVAAGSNGYLDERIVDKAFESIQEAAVILIQLEIPLPTVEFAIKKGIDKGWKVIVNPAPARQINKGAFRDLYLITPNEYEAEILTGVRVTDIDSAEQAAQTLRQLGVSNVVITLGSRGAFLHTRSLRKVIPAPTVTPIDTTAAGDCFNGAIAVALSQGVEMEGAVGFACQAASVSVTRMGAQSSMPSRKELNEIFPQSTS